MGSLVRQTGKGPPLFNTPPLRLIWWDSGEKIIRITVLNRYGVAVNFHFWFAMFRWLPLVALLACSLRDREDTAGRSPPLPLFPRYCGIRAHLRLMIILPSRFLLVADTSGLLT